MGALHALLAVRQPSVESMAPDLQVQGRKAQLSTGEASFLWSFAQASIMLPEVRQSLRRSWGLCPRHASGWLIVESAFRHRYLHGPAVLYDDLMEIASKALAHQRPMAAERLAWNLATRGICHLCGMGIGPEALGFIEHKHWDKARDAAGWLEFLAETRPLWIPNVCGRCDGSTGPARCRRHLVQDITEGTADLDQATMDIRWIADHVHRYDRSFRWECQGSDTAEDHAALVVAIGWCGGWSSLLALTRDAIIEAVT